MVREDSAKTDWFREILRAKADPVDRAPAEDAAVLGAAGREAEAQAERAGLVGRAVEVVASAELRAECLEAEAVAPEVVAAVAGADD